MGTCWPGPPSMITLREEREAVWGYEKRSAVQRHWSIAPMSWLLSNSPDDKLSMPDLINISTNLPLSIWIAFHYLRGLEEQRWQPGRQGKAAISWRRRFVPESSSNRRSMKEQQRERNPVTIWYRTITQAVGLTLRSSRSKKTLLYMSCRYGLNRWNDRPDRNSWSAAHDDCRIRAFRSSMQVIKSWMMQPKFSIIIITPSFWRHTWTLNVNLIR